MIPTQSSSCVLKVQSHPFHGNVLICYNTPANLERATLSHYQRTEEVYTPLDISVFIGYIRPR